MKDIRVRRKKSTYVLFAAVFCVVYIVLSARPLGSEWQLMPQWRLDINTATVMGMAPSAPKGEAAAEGASDAEKDAPSRVSAGSTTLAGDATSSKGAPAAEQVTSVPFKLGQNMGYFSSDGQMLMLLSFPFKASIADKRYVRYTATATNTAFYNNDGTKAGVLDSSGFPLFEDDRIYLFTPGGSSFAQLDTEGKTMWHYGGTVPITAFDSSDAACVAGFADGSVKEFAPNGHIVQEFSPGGSDVSVILGAGVSHDGNMLATVSGQDRQRFVLAKRGGAQTRIVYHEYVEGDVHQRLVQFVADDSVVYYDTASVLGVVNTRTFRASHIPIEGQAVSLKECGALRFVLTRSDAADTEEDKPLTTENTGERVYAIYIIEKFDTVVGSFKFKAHNAFIRTDRDSLYVGCDNAISRMKVEKK